MVVGLMWDCNVHIHFSYEIQLGSSCKVKFNTIFHVVLDVFVLLVIISLVIINYNYVLGNPTTVR